MQPHFFSAGHHRRLWHSISSYSRGGGVVRIRWRAGGKCKCLETPRRVPISSSRGACRWRQLGGMSSKHEVEREEQKI